MRAAFLILLLANLLWFAGWAGLFGEREGVREPARLQKQLAPEKLKVVSSVTAHSAEGDGCRQLEGLSNAEAEKLLAIARQTGLKAELAGGGHSAYVVRIPGLPDRDTADRKAQQLVRLGISEQHVVNEPGGLKFALALGEFADEAQAKARLDALRSRGVRSAVVVPRDAASDHGVVRVRGPAPLLQSRMAELFGTAASRAVECQ